MTKNLHIQNILKNSKKDTEWKKEAEERKSVRQESRKSGIIATQLAYYMKVNGISQTDLGNRIGVSPQQISKILKGRENLTLGTIEKIETALNIDLIKTVDHETVENRLHFVHQAPKSSVVKLNLSTGTTEITFGEPRFYGETLKNPPFPAFTSSYFDEIKQKAIARAQERFESLKNTREFHFESEAPLVPIVNYSKKPIQKENDWLDFENFVTEEI